jgi:hypothetical protein
MVVGRGFLIEYIRPIATKVTRFESVYDCLGIH